MPTRAQVERAIEALEKQRSSLGDDVTDLALAELQARLQTLDIPLPQTGERKLVTVLFADISGFTSLSERADPEIIRTLINQIFERMVPLIEHNGGTVEKFIGDEIMAIFGAPVAHENDAERAVRTAIEMMNTLSQFNAEKKLNLGMHIGVNTGLVIAGMLGTLQHQQYGVLGDTVNLAARLEDASERGQIFVGPNTHRLTSPLFEYTEVGPIQVKGKAKPVLVYQVVGTRTHPGNVRGLETVGLRSRLVGRETELAALTEKIKGVVHGRGGIVGVIGDAGMGKSRLTVEARRAGETLPLVWLEGRALSYGQTISYWPFREILRQACNITDQDEEAQVWQKLEEQARAFFPNEVAQIMPALASILALPLPEEYAQQTRQLDVETLRRQFFLSMRRFIERLAQTLPLVMVFEDLHWADQSSVDLLEHLLPLVKTSRLLILVVTRPEFRSPGGRLLGRVMQEYRDAFTGVWLEPLSRQQSAQLLTNLLSLESLPARFQSLVVEKAEGNPFYVEEVIRALIALNAIVFNPANGQWQASRQIESVNIPDTIQGIIMARVDQLGEEMKEVLRLAAVIGRAFSFRLLQAIDPSNHRLGWTLEELQQLELIREKSRTPELTFIFKHTLTQEAIYESILIQKRREIHAQIGRSIEKLYANRLEQYYSLLAYHYARAEEWEKVQGFLLKAGDQAIQMAADSEALAHYRQALEIFTASQGPGWDKLQRASLELKMAEAYFRRGDHNSALDTLAHVLSLTGRPVPLTINQIRWELTQQIGIQALHRALPRILYKKKNLPNRDQILLRGRALELLSWIDVWNQPLRASLDALSLLNLGEQTGLKDLEELGAGGLCYVSSMMGFHRAADYYQSRAIALAEELKTPAALSHAYVMAANHEMLAGTWEQSLEHFRRAIRAYEHTGNLRGKGLAMIAMAIVRRLRGEYNQSLEISRQVVQLGREGADAQVMAWGYNGTALIGWLLGSLPEAEAIHTIEEAIQTYRAIPDYSGLVTGLATLGMIYIETGKLKNAIKVLEESMKILGEHGVRASSATPAYNTLAAAYLALAESLGASETIGAKEKNTWLEKARLACVNALRHARVDQGGLAEAQRLRGWLDWLHGEQTEARHWWERSIATSKRFGQPYEMAIAHVEIGARFHWQMNFLQAEAILTKIGALRPLERAKQA
jgi:class 3 adenylate cyclase/tetratricopeptide (TPR) repeat protein